mmetsp:Transcript_46501/g.107325  ORF Transcript_46501/g.107325 Transcript_46501/m.107325 type:complete len:255 (+) Transcript_46501:770-1534(+)
MMYMPSRTVSLLLCRIFWLRTTEVASQTSELSMSTKPRTVACNSPFTSSNVPTTMPETHHMAARVGNATPNRRMTMSTMRGVKALSIWMKPKLKWRYTALPVAIVSAFISPMTPTFCNQVNPAISFQVSSRISEILRRTAKWLTTVELTRPRLQRLIGWLKCKSSMMYLFSIISAGPTTMKIAHAVSVASIDLKEFNVDVRNCSTSLLLCESALPATRARMSIKHNHHTSCRGSPSKLISPTGLVECGRPARPP